MLRVVSALRRWRRPLLFFGNDGLCRDPRVARVFLVGGFGGSWNFGDIVQLQSAISWHLRRHRLEEIVPIVAARNVRSAGDVALIRGAFGTPNLLAFGGAGDAGGALQEIELRGRPSTLHFYGGGALNSFWAETRLPVIEALLSRCRPEHYVVSGQQVAPLLGPRVAAHLRQHGARIVGCRDEESVKILTTAGIHALNSGDDTWEMFDLCRHRLDSKRRGASSTPAFAVQIGFADHVFVDYGDTRRASRRQRLLAAVKAVDEMLAQAAHESADGATAILVNGYRDPRDLLDSGSSARLTSFGRLFPESVTLDLPGLAMKGSFVERGSTVLSRYDIHFFAGNYYHPSLFFQCLGVPTFLHTFNEYYRQKVQGLGIPFRTFQDFRITAQEEHGTRIRGFNARHREIRRHWLERLAEVCS
jgi:hypothetical protein